MTSWAFRGRYEEIVERVRAGDSYGKVARDLGCTAQAVMYHCHKAGVRSAPDNRRAVSVEIDGERLTLSEAGRRYGIGLTTIHMRYQAGDRGPALVRPVRPAPKPCTYQLGLSQATLEGYAELGRALGVDAAARKTGVPKGAIGAAMRREWWRLA